MFRQRKTKTHQKKAENGVKGICWNRIANHLLELGYDALDELRWCTVHSNNGNLLARVKDLEAVCETLP